MFSVFQYLKTLLTCNELIFLSQNSRYIKFKSSNKKIILSITEMVFLELKTDFIIFFFFITKHEKHYELLYMEIAQILTLKIN